MFYIVARVVSLGEMTTGSLELPILCVCARLRACVCVHECVRVCERADQRVLIQSGNRASSQKTPDRTWHHKAICSVTRVSDCRGQRDLTRPLDYLLSDTNAGTRPAQADRIEPPANALDPPYLAAQHTGLCAGSSSTQLVVAAISSLWPWKSSLLAPKAAWFFSQILSSRRWSQSAACHQNFVVGPTLRYPLLANPYGSSQSRCMGSLPTFDDVKFEVVPTNETTAVATRPSCTQSPFLHTSWYRFTRDGMPSLNTSSPRAHLHVVVMLWFTSKT